MLAALEAAGLAPSPPADRRTLIRRVYYDLIGLPPTAAETEAFENDRSADAFARIVDRLLDSPHYGERWGRHWLDVARYADTKDGVLMFGDDRVRPYAYTYRDYVIRAFNEDLGFDRFVHEQLAADVVAPKDQSWRLAAMGFLTLGRMFDNNFYDQIDDRIDTVTRGFLGLTVACARCHDHKYDAIPTADYYSLYGVFASSEPPLELPLIERPGQPCGGAEFEKQVSTKRRELREFVEAQYKLLAGRRGSERLTTWYGRARCRRTRSKRRFSSCRWRPKTCARRSSLAGGATSSSESTRTIRSLAPGTSSFRSRIPNSRRKPMRSSRDCRLKARYTPRRVESADRRSF